jgi:SSS family solute:Na+ symporter
VLTLTFAATFHSAYAFTGIVGFIYNDGVGFWVNGLWLVPPALLFWLLGRRLWILGKRHNFLSMAEYMGTFYGSNLVSILTVMIHALFITPYIGIQLTGSGYIFQTITQGMIPFSWGAAVMMIILIIYVWAGGMRAVAWTDTFQGIFMFVGILLGSWMIVRNVAGSPVTAFSDALKEIPAFFSLPGPKGALTPYNYISRWVVICLGMAMGPHIVIRMFTARSLKVLKWASILGAMYLTFIYWLTPAVGALARVTSPDAASPDRLMVDYLWQYTPVLLASILLAGGFAAAMSTADSQAHAVSTTLAVDIYKKHINPQASSQKITQVSRWMILVISLISLWIAIYRPTMLVNLLAISTGGLAQLAPAFVGSLYWRHSTRAGAIASLIGGTVVMIMTQFFWRNPFGLQVLPAFWGLLAGTSLFLGVSLFTEKVPLEILDETQGFVSKVLEG